MNDGGMKFDLKLINSLKYFPRDNNSNVTKALSIALLGTSQFSRGNAGGVWVDGQTNPLKT